MGGQNPFKNFGREFRRLGDNLIVKPTRDALKSTYDVINDTKFKEKQAEDQKNKAMKKAAAEKTRIEGEKATAAAAETAKVENARMSAGSASRTLLTGPAGLTDEDEEDGVSVTRRTLMGM